MAESSMGSNPELARELLALRAEDERVREELARDGSLFEGYHPRMQQVHDRNAARLAEIINEFGWPGRTLVGDEAAEAAWLLLQHAIAQPDFQRRGLELLREAAARGETPAWCAAYLEDRIRVFEGRPQLYGTQFEPDEDGVPAPQPPIEDEAHVDERRLAVGMETLAERTEMMRRWARESGERAPRKREGFQREYEAWLRRVGWRK